MRTRAMMRGTVLLLWGGALQAGVADPERLKIDLGIHFITNTATTPSYVSPASVGVTVNTERDLDMEYSLNVFRLNGRYRFNDTTALDFGYYAFDRNGETALEYRFTDTLGARGSLLRPPASGWTPTRETTPSAWTTSCSV